MKITAPLLVIFLTAIFLFLAATNIQGGWLYVVDALLWSVVFLAFVLPFLQLRRLQLKRHFLNQAVAEFPVSVELTLKNQRRWPLMFLNLEEGPIQNLRTGQTLQPDTDKFFAVSVGYGEELSYPYSFVPPNPGVFSFQSVHTGSFGPLGLLGLYWKQNLPSALVVLPIQAEVSSQNLLEEHFQDIRQARRRSHSAEDISHFRSYQTGDSRRAIHWRNSARYGQLIVAEAREEPFQQALVLFNTEQKQANPAFYALVQEAEKVCSHLLEHKMEIFCQAQAAEPTFWNQLQLSTPPRRLSAIRTWEGLSYWLATLMPDAQESFDRHLSHNPVNSENMLIILFCTELPSFESLRNLAQGKGSSGLAPLLIYCTEPVPSLPEDLASILEIRHVEAQA